MPQRGPQHFSNLIVGDYLQLTTGRVSSRCRGEDEGFACIERIEYLFQRPSPRSSSPIRASPLARFRWCGAMACPAR
jgi:hypothetical protein